MYGKVITPMVQSPLSWIPEMYGGEIPDMEEEKLLAYINFFSTLYNWFLQQLHADILEFPFSYANLDNDKLDGLYQWIYGLHEALKQHYDIWLSEEEPFIHNEELEDVSLSLFYVHSLARPDEIPDTWQSEDAFDPTASDTVVNLLAGMPSVITTLTRYGRVRDLKRMDALSTAGTPSGKVGRNAPCPCGSGKKYKKCCG